MITHNDSYYYYYVYIVMEQVHHNHPGLQVIYSILTTAALAFVVACLVLNIFFLRRNRLAVLKFAMTELDILPVLVI